MVPGKDSNRRALIFLFVLQLAASLVSDRGEGGCERGGPRTQLKEESLHPSRGIYCTPVLRIRDPVAF